MVRKQSFDTTALGICDTRQRSLFEDALTRVMQHLARDASFQPCDGDRIHALALEGLVHALLGTGSNETVHVYAGIQAMEEAGLGPVTPEQVGLLYEYGRGFKPLIDPDGRVTLSSSAAGKRNQGLFYTPEPIVRHIVDAALDALSLSGPADFLHLRLLDPAVGTGTFLLYALDALTDRVLNGRKTTDDLLSVAIARIHDNLRETARREGFSCDPDEETAIRIHLMSTCMYGVDLDPLAVHIARTALLRRAFREMPVLPGMEPHIRAGNALIGSTSGSRPDRDEGDDDRRHAQAYFGRKPAPGNSFVEWVQEKKVFHWAHEFPAVFSDSRGGFDCVIGNPPYEIVSVKESGIHHRKLEQKYFRAQYRTCQGKINTYRVMLERGLALLRDGGVLGFIVPATLLADSTAEKLRRVILQETRIVESLVIPETAQAFEGVTQAFLVLVCRKGERTFTVEPVPWDGASPISAGPQVPIHTDLVERIGYRIPLLKTPREKALLELLMEHPPLQGDDRVPPVGRVHQGEMNLTVDRAFMTDVKTDYPLIRGEHVMPLKVCHPSRQQGRLDWIIPEFLEQEALTRGMRKGGKGDTGSRTSKPPRPWEQHRIVLGRVVNMDTRRRLKAAAVPTGRFLGDMTNFIPAPGLPKGYLLGLLNSRVLNWRIKLTSTNNYLSAAEVESLPVPRPDFSSASQDAVCRTCTDLAGLCASSERSVYDWIAEIKRAVHTATPSGAHATVAAMVGWIVQEIRNTPEGPDDVRDPSGNLWNALDAAVLLLYACESYADVLL